MLGLLPATCGPAIRQTAPNPPLGPLRGLADRRRFRSRPFGLDAHRADSPPPFLTVHMKQSTVPPVEDGTHSALSEASPRRSPPVWQAQPSVKPQGLDPGHPSPACTESVSRQRELTSSHHRYAELQTMRPQCHRTLLAAPGLSRVLAVPLPRLPAEQLPPAGAAQTSLPDQQLLHPPPPPPTIGRENSGQADHARYSHPCGLPHGVFATGSARHSTSPNEQRRYRNSRAVRYVAVALGAPNSLYPMPVFKLSPQSLSYEFGPL